MKFYCALLLFSCLTMCKTMRLETKSSMEYSSPDGGNKMFVERSAQSDMDSSASGFIYHSDGTGPVNVVKLGDNQAFSDVNQAYESLIHPIIHAGGAVHNAGFQNAAGIKGDNGYKAFDEFQKGILKKFATNHDTGFYQNAAGNKQAHHDQAGYYQGFDEAKKGEQGGNFAEEKSHNKGHKTTGFHNVYHKDEYKKEHSFYDESDNKGHYDKYNKGHSAFQNAAGAFKKGGHLDAAFQAGESAKKGFFDKGQSANEEAGYEGKHGGQSHFANQQNYGKSDDGNYQQHFGFANDQSEDDH